MPTQPRDVVQKRLEDVENALLVEPWTMATQRALAERHNVQPRQIRKDAQKIRDAWTESAKQINPHESKADWLNRLRMAQHQARVDGHTIALGRLLSLEARCMGYESPVNVNVNHSVETLDPIAQASAIVQYYPDAVRLLESVGETSTVIDAAYETQPALTTHDTGETE